MGEPGSNVRGACKWAISTYTNVNYPASHPDAESGSINTVLPIFASDRQPLDLFSAFPFKKLFLNGVNYSFISVSRNVFP